MINVLFFGPVVERLGMRDCQIPCVEGMTLQCLHDQLAAIYPHAFEIVCFCAVNGWQVRDLSVELVDGSEETFMAKFSGG